MRGSASAPRVASALACIASALACAVLAGCDVQQGPCAEGYERRMGVCMQLPVDGGPIDAGSDPCAVPDPIDLAGLDTNCDGVDGVRGMNVYLAPTGNDDATGAIDDPVRTLGRAITIAGPRPILVALGTYDERDLEPMAGRMQVHGGYDASASWARTVERPVVLLPAGGLALFAAAGSSSTIERVELRAAAGDASVPSSQVLRFEGRSGERLTLRDVVLLAGAGAAGADGAAGIAGLAGRSGNGGSPCTRSVSTLECAGAGSGGASLLATCGGSPGAGGASAVQGDDASDGAMGGAAGAMSAGVAGATGERGADGIDGDPAALASFAPTGIVRATAAAGAMGAAGGAGAGGGGGASGVDASMVCACATVELGCAVLGAGTVHGGGGGGGGEGGCSGTPGTGGESGGGSVGVYAVGSVVISLEDSAITTGAGGAGGEGGAGGAGGDGGEGGRGATGCAGPRSSMTTVTGSPVWAGGDGGDGGAGGRGGHGGGGAGGPSVGVVLVGGATLERDAATTIEPGAAGAGGVSAGLSGPEGQRAETLTVE